MFDKCGPAIQMVQFENVNTLHIFTQDTSTETNFYKSRLSQGISRNLQGFIRTKTMSSSRALENGFIKEVLFEKYNWTVTLT